MQNPQPFLTRQLTHKKLWFAAFIAFLALCLAANCVLRPHEPHFGFDAYFGFWALFGLGVGLLMIVVMKRLVQPLIVRPEDYYHDL